MAAPAAPELDLAKCFTGEQQLVYVAPFPGRHVTN